MKKHIHIMGASGSGVTTLGSNLAAALGYAHLDTDDFFWETTTIPFTLERPVEMRVKLLEKALKTQEKWVLSGDLHRWGTQLEPYYDFVIFVYLPKEIRKQRIAKRETKRYGRDIAVGGKLYQKSMDFMAWAMLYDDPEATITRTATNHMRWLEGLACPHLKIMGNYTEAESTAMAMAKIKEE